MARFVGGRDLEPVFAAVRVWIDSCLIGDGSVFSTAALWTEENLSELSSRTAKATGDGDYFEKLEAQLKGAAPAIPQLMAELLWALYVFPDNIGIKTKREHVCETWDRSGAPLEPKHPALADKVICGIGSGGQAFFSLRPREVAFLLRIALHTKTLKTEERRRAFSDYDAFVDLIDEVPEKGNRQFRHMLRYMLFPDRVERISSEQARVNVLAGYVVAPRKEIEEWGDREIDDALLELRRKLEKEHKTDRLDFYAAPLRSRWKAEEEEGAGEGGDEEGERGRQYWAGGFGENVEKFLNGNYWKIGWARDSDDPAGRRTWERFAGIRTGDYFAIKGLGGTNDLKVHYVGEVISVDPENGRLDLKRLDVPLYKGKGPTKRGAGNWHDTIVPITRPDVISMIFGVEGAAVPAPRKGEPNGDPINLILYGPPGTGKTWTLQSEYFPRYTDQPSDLDRATWEQDLVSSFGWRTVIAAALSLLGRPTKVPDLAEDPLVVAKTRQMGRTTSVVPTLWGALQMHTPEDVKTVRYAERRPPFLFTKSNSSEWSLLPEWDEVEDDGRELARRFAAGPKAATVPIARYRLVTFHPSYSYEDFVVGLRPVAGEDGRTTFTMVDGVFKQICSQARANPSKRYALFIDEINRANIAKVFGELITLIEPDKRARYADDGRLESGIEVQLPGEKSDSRFGVPANLDIYGTMNTADRSIALLDIALRRRFEFRELPPRYDVLRKEVEGVHLGELLRAMNDRVEFLADRERRIGHAYFSNVETLQDLRDVIRHRIIPLLQEYFFDDWRHVERVLSTPDGSSPFIRRETLRGEMLFAGREDIEREERVRFVVTDDEDWSAGGFRAIYESVPDVRKVASSRE